MARYPLPRSHAPAIRSGRQRLTLAAPRAAAQSGHATLGGSVQLALAATLEARAETVAVRDCILRATVIITPDALVRVIGLTHRTNPGESLSRLLINAENGAAGDLAKARLALARAAGFRSWRSLYAWNSHRDRRGRPDADGRVTRELIGWAA